MNRDESWISEEDSVEQEEDLDDLDDHQVHAEGLRYDVDHGHRLHLRLLRGRVLRLGLLRVWRRQHHLLRQRQVGRCRRGRQGDQVFQQKRQRGRLGHGNPNGDRWWREQ